MRHLPNKGIRHLPVGASYPARFGIAAWVVTLAVALSLTSSIASAAFDRSPQQAEYDLKAAFLINFAKFVQWPETAFEGPDDPLRVCVFRHDPFGGALAGMEGRMVQNRAVVVEQRDEVEDLEGCHVLFVDRTQMAWFRKIVRVIEGREVLTVTDFEEAMDPRGIINMFIRRARIVFAIDEESAEHAGLLVSSRLLELAVRPQSSGPVSR